MNKTREEYDRHAHKVLKNGTREEVIAWLVRTDPNGVWTDEDSITEGMMPLTLEEARKYMQRILTRD